MTLFSPISVSNNTYHGTTGKYAAFIILWTTVVFKVYLIEIPMASFALDRRQATVWLTGDLSRVYNTSFPMWTWMYSNLQQIRGE